MTVEPDLWRLNSLYTVVDKAGKRVPFRLNWAQKELLDNLHTFNLILKARQLGFSTLIQLLALDTCLFTANTRAGTIAHTMPAAQSIFARLKYAYDALDDGIKARCPLTASNATDLQFGNGSSIRVATSMRGDTLQFLHISEYGKLCAKFPERAREVRTGALNTVQSGNLCFIESTAEGQEGHFFELCEQAQSKRRLGAELSALDFRFAFFPWWKEPGYALRPTGAAVPENYTKYFQKLAETQGIVLSAGQKSWYIAKSETQAGDVKREYPSTPEEAFEAAVEGAFYADQLAAAELQGRIGEFPADERVPVDTVWDLGFGDYTAIWFAQLLPDLRRRLVGYYQNSGEGMIHYVDMVRRMARERGWKLGDHYLPQDAWAHEWSSGRTRSEHFREAMHVFPKRVPQESVEDGINAVRQVLGRCEFDEAACSEGLKALRAYRREWDDERGIYRDRPRHDWASHGSDAFRYLSLLKRDPRAVDLPAQRFLPKPRWHFERQPDGTTRSNFTILELINERKRRREARA